MQIATGLMGSPRVYAELGYQGHMLNRYEVDSTVDKYLRDRPFMLSLLPLDPHG